MNRLNKPFLPGCLLLLLTSGCLSRPVPLTPQPLTNMAVKPASLSDYIRGVYKLSSEASQQLEQRSALLVDAPELQELIDHLEDLTVDVDDTGEHPTKVRVFCE